VNVKEASGPALDEAGGVISDDYLQHPTSHDLFPMTSSPKSKTTHVDEDVDDLDGTGYDTSSTLIVLITGNTRRSRAILLSSSQVR
jgi:hypothetical protein